MSVQTVGKKFVELCRKGKNFDVMRTMYDPKIVSVEGDGKETAGQGPVIKKSEDWVSDKIFHGETVAGPFFNGANPDQFTVYFTLDVTPKATGTRITLEEVGIYTVKNDLITREQFFYEARTDPSLETNVVVPPKTVIVTGASQGIGAGVVEAFVERGFNVVANSRTITRSTEIAASNRVALVDGHIGEPATAARIVETALSRFKSIDALVNNAGIFFTKPFTDYTADDFRSLVSTNLEGFLYITQRVIKQMLAQKTPGSIVTITAALARNPIRGVNAAVPMITKGGLDTITQHLAMEYAKDGIRVNAVAPGVVDTPLHKDDSKEELQSLNPMGVISSVKDIVDAVMFLTDAATVTGDTIYVDGGALISAAGKQLTKPIGETHMNTITTKDGTQIFFKDWGKGQPIVFSHGWPLSADDWDGQMMFFLNRGYRVIAHDRRGHGRSSQVSDGHDMDHYADDLAAVTAHLDLKNAVHVGHSTGGGEVARYIGHGASRVAKAVLISAVPPLMVKTAANPGGLPKEVFDGLQSQLAANRSQFYLDLASGPFYGFNRPGAKTIQGLIWNWWRQGMMGGAKAHYDGIVAFSQTDFTEDLRKFTVPTLVMHGDDDQIVPYADSGPLSAKLVKGAILKTYKGFPHGMPATNADQINADLLEFIKS